jgi:hypothetical protein
MGRSGYSQIEIREYALKLGKGERTLQRWVSQGCNLRDPKSVREWVTRNEIRQTPMERARRRRRDEAQKAAATPHVITTERVSVPTNGELPPAGRKGAAAALERLESAEESAHRRLQAALSRGNAIEIENAQNYWLKCSEVLRRLDLAVETARREAESQVALRVACDAQLAGAEWMRIAFMQFLSSEGKALQGIKDFGEWKAYAVERFRGVLNLVVKAADKTNSPIPPWALERIKEAWNVPAE